MLIKILFYNNKNYSKKYLWSKNFYRNVFLHRIFLFFIFIYMCIIIYIIIIIFIYILLLLLLNYI
jgi:hypothetical protein